MRLAGVAERFVGLLAAPRSSCRPASRTAAAANRVGSAVRSPRLRGRPRGGRRRVHVALGLGQPRLEPVKLRVRAALGTHLQQLARVLESAVAHGGVRRGQQVVRSQLSRSCSATTPAVSDCVAHLRGRGRRQVVDDGFELAQRGRVELRRRGARGRAGGRRARVSLRRSPGDLE